MHKAEERERQQKAEHAQEAANRNSEKALYDAQANDSMTALTVERDTIAGSVDRGVLSKSLAASATAGINKKINVTKSTKRTQNGPRLN